jgi:hypothetical protein
MMSPLEMMDPLRVFLNSMGGLVALLTAGFVLELLFAVALFRWKPLAFVNAWIALVLAMLLAIASGQHTAALMLAILAVLNLVDIPLVALLRSRLI